MNHPEYKNGAYLFSPVSDNRPLEWVGDALLVLCVLVVCSGIYLWGTK